MCHPSTLLKSVKDRALHIWACLRGLWTGKWKLNHFKVSIFLYVLRLFPSYCVSMDVFIRFIITYFTFRVKKCTSSVREAWPSSQALLSTNITHLLLVHFTSTALNLHYSPPIGPFYQLLCDHLKFLGHYWSLFKNTSMSFALLLKFNIACNWSISIYLVH